MPPDPPSPEDRHDERKSRALAYVVAAAFFMEYLDTAIIATALPQMAQSFSVGPNQVSLGMSAYMLTLAVFIPVSGWIADRFGSRTVFALAMILFTISSVLCGLSGDMVSFTIARVLQGIGGAMMVPVGRMIVVRNTGKDRMMWAISTITWPAIIAPLLGPVVGGFLTTYASWRWAFFINVPFGIAALISIIWLVPNQFADRKVRFDLTGFLLSAVALTCLFYGAERASHPDGSILTAIGFMSAGFMTGGLSIAHFRRAKAPLLDLTTLRVQTFRVSLLCGSAMRTGLEAIPYLLPLLFQIGFGLSAFQSGLLLLATAAGNLGMKPFTTAILRRFGFRSVLIANGLLAGLVILACGWLSPSTPLVFTGAVLTCYGLARSLQFTSLNTLVYADVTDAQKGPASVLMSSAHQMTIGIGIALGAISLRSAGYLNATTTGDIAAPYSLADFKVSFLLVGALVLICVLGFLGLSRDAGSSIGGGSLRKTGRRGASENRAPDPADPDNKHI